jgi:hypothetical protein
MLKGLATVKAGKRLAFVLKGTSGRDRRVQENPTGSCTPGAGDGLITDRG